MGTIITRFDEVFFDDEKAVFDFFSFTGEGSSLKSRFERVINREGHIVIWRQTNFTLDTAHGSPQSAGSPTDANVTVMIHPLTIQELNTNFFEQGMMRIMTSADNFVQVDDRIF